MFLFSVSSAHRLRFLHVQRRYSFRCCLSAFAQGWNDKRASEQSRPGGAASQAPGRCGGLSAPANLRPQKARGFSGAVGTGPGATAASTVTPVKLPRVRRDQRRREIWTGGSTQKVCFLCCCWGKGGGCWISSLEACQLRTEPSHLCSIVIAKDKLNGGRQHTAPACSLRLVCLPV